MAAASLSLKSLFTVPRDSLAASLFTDTSIKVLDSAARDNKGRELHPAFTELSDCLISSFFPSFLPLFLPPEAILDSLPWIAQISAWENGNTHHQEVQVLGHPLRNGCCSCPFSSKMGQKQSKGTHGNHYVSRAFISAPIVPRSPASFQWLVSATPAWMGALFFPAHHL